MIQIKRIILVVLGMLFLFSSLPLNARPDTQIDLRLFKGSFSDKTPKNESVTTSYFLKPMVSGTLILDADMKEERDEIKKVFNLRDLELITQAKWGWKKGGKIKQTQAISLDNREFLLLFSQLEKYDHFKLEVVEKSKEKNKKSLNPLPLSRKK